jgi:hypothetical protein
VRCLSKRGRNIPSAPGDGDEIPKPIRIVAIAERKDFHLAGLFGQGMGV